jgi:hypothetical protein
MNLEISAKKTLIALMAASLAFVAIHLLGQYVVHYTDLLSQNWHHHLIRALNVDAEASIPTWFSQVVLFMAGSLLLLIAYIKKQEKAPWRRHWFILGLIMLYVSMDEGAELHEIAAGPVGDWLGIQAGYLYFAWVIPAMILLALAIGAFFDFWLKLPRRTKILFAASFILFVSGALGIEMLGAHYASTRGRDFGYYALAGLEEGLEMAGASLFLYSLLDYLRGFNLPKIKIL